MKELNEIMPSRNVSGVFQDLSKVAIDRNVIPTTRMCPQ